MNHFADHLAAACRALGNSVCVGLDPRWEHLPGDIHNRHGGETLRTVAGAYEEFCSRVIDVVAPLVPMVKPQSAFFEACGPDGMHALQRVLAKARQKGLITILDGKRNDIASTATAYADAGLGGVSVGRGQWPVSSKDNPLATHSVWDADALTVNPYLGRDAVKPFLESARRYGRGIFVLVRTSNPEAGQFQDLVCDGRPVYEHVGMAVGQWARENLGKCGFGDVGAVVGATYPDELEKLRKLIPEVLFLVPGFGAQGGSAKDVAPAFREDGLGAVVNSSRGIISSFNQADANWELAVEKATQDTIASLFSATPMNRLKM
jgi:orotidine-5'-phosphate decarboxylase